MKTELSKYLVNSKPVLTKLIQELSKEFAYVSILGVDTKGKKYSIQRTGTSLGDSTWTERGFVLRVYNGVNYSEYSFNEIDMNDINQFIEDTKYKLSQAYKAVSESDLNLTEYPLIDEDTITESFIGQVEILPSAMTSEEKVKKLSNIMNDALSYSDRLVDFRVNYEEVHISKIFLSNKRNLEQSYIWSQGMLIAIARKDDVTKFNYDGFANLKGLELMDLLYDEYKRIVDDTVALLDAKRIEPGEYDIICAPDVSGLIAHEAFGHGVEMDMFVKNRAKALEYVSKAVGSNLVSMHDGAKSTYNVSSYLFDDEGTLGGDTKVIDQGILKTGLSDVLSAMKLNTTPTGNGKRESFERKAYARMTNTFFTGGSDKLEDMIKAIDKGYLLEGVMSGMEDPKNWGIQCMLIQGKEIVDGKLTGNIVSPVIMTGYVPDVLNSIDMVSEEVKVYGTGTCGKGHKEWVKTADGGPYMKAKGRLG